MSAEIATRLREFPDYTTVNIGKHRATFNQWMLDAADALDAKDKRIAELEAALKPFARVGHMMVFAGATADNEIELSGEELHPALLAASRSLPNKEDRNG